MIDYLSDPKPGELPSIKYVGISYEEGMAKKKKDELNELLSQEEREQRYLDLGEINDVWYYGFRLNGREAIIKSDRKVLRNTEEEFKGIITGTNEIADLFEYSGYIGDIAPTIKNETVKRFINNEKRLTNPKQIYQRVRDKILYYMDFAGQDEIADVLACWAIATYCYPIFPWFPHILINAPSSSGKSKCANLLKELSFRGFDLGASAGVTPAQIFRTLEGNRGTVLIDEFEILDKSDSQQLVNQILNAAAARDAFVIRSETVGKKWTTKKFPIFSPKIVCNISGINPTSLSRFIAFKWLKSNSEKSKRKPDRKKDKEAIVPIREELHLLILENHSEIKKTYEELDLPTLTGRVEDNWLPLFAVARFVDAAEGEPVNAEAQVGKYLTGYNDLEVETEDESAEFFALLLAAVPDEPQTFTPKDISEWPDIGALLGGRTNPAQWIGRKLKLFKFKRGARHGRATYLLSKQIVQQMIDLYYPNKELPLPIPTTPTHTTHHYQPLPEVGVGRGGSCTVLALDVPQKTTKKVYFLKEAPERIGLDGKAYPAAEAGTIQELPSEETQSLIDLGYCKLADPAPPFVPSLSEHKELPSERREEISSEENKA